MVVAIDENHVYTLNGKKLLGVTELIRRGGIDLYSGVNEEVMANAANFGTAVHRVCEFDDRGTLDQSSVDPALLPYLEAWRKFKKDYHVVFELENIEKMVCSKILGYAGTLDRKAKIKGKWTVIDLKSVVTMLPTTGVQLAGYKIAENEMLQLSGKGGFSRGRIQQSWGVQLKPDGTYKIHDYDHPIYETTFRSLLNVNRFKNTFNIN